tara:strand:- start:69 stop:227 length:159 start_codon:yes stop_codon:yes gene_type:complete
MSDLRTRDRLEEIYEEVLDDCPEYSDPDSIHYDLEHCEVIAKARFEREADQE